MRSCQSVHFKSLKQITVLLLSIISLCFNDVTAQNNKTDYYVYHLKTKQKVNLQSVINDFAKADVLLFGEEHNDSIGHIAEADLLKLAHTQLQSALSLSMEMFESDVQLVLNEYLSGTIKEKNLIKDARVWNNYDDYKPIIDFAMLNNIPIIAANAPSRYTNLVSRAGIKALENLSADAKKYLHPLPIDTATGKYYENFVNLMGSNHMGGLQIFQAQNVWDATMAYFISKEVKNNKKVLQINGRFHSDEKLGIASQLKMIKKTTEKPLKVINISCFAAEDFENPNFENYQNLADYLILTKPALK